MVYWIGALVIVIGLLCLMTRWVHTHKDVGHKVGFVMGSVFSILVLLCFVCCSRLVVGGLEQRVGYEHKIDVERYKVDTTYVDVLGVSDTCYVLYYSASR